MRMFSIFFLDNEVSSQSENPGQLLKAHRSRPLPNPLL
jgi:hypothetical protein